MSDGAHIACHERSRRIQIASGRSGRQGSRLHCLDSISDECELVFPQGCLRSSAPCCDSRAPQSFETRYPRSEGPKDFTMKKRPRDPAQLAKFIVDVATGEIEDRAPTPEEQGKDPAAAALGRRGGAARAAKMTPERRSQIAKNAAKKR